MKGINAPHPLAGSSAEGDIATISAELTVDRGDLGVEIFDHLDGGEDTRTPSFRELLACRQFSPRTAEQIGGQAGVAEGEQPPSSTSRQKSRRLRLKSNPACNMKRASFAVARR